MKKLFTIISMLLLCAAASFAQAPQKFSYQAAVCGANGKSIAGQDVVVDISIFRSSLSGKQVYSESHTTKVSDAGTIDLEVGSGKVGSVSGAFSEIEWGKDSYFITSRVVQGSEIIAEVSSQLLSVPYALHADYVPDEVIDRRLRNLGIIPVDVEGALPGKFSVSSTEQISFSKGNLQYQASTQTWRFAEHQYDVIGSNNSKISATYSGWIDLFGWGTSGVQNRYPYLTSTKDEDYGYPNNPEKDITNTKLDWGVYNAISNGGNKAGMWRTLTGGEWDWLVLHRKNADNLKGRAKVGGVKGYVLLPDDWSLPEGIQFNPKASDCTINVYTDTEWKKMEIAGAVFLPCGGGRTSNSVFLVGSRGEYWSTTVCQNDGYPYEVGFNDVEDGEYAFGSTLNIDPSRTLVPHTGACVRLVK